MAEIITPEQIRAELNSPEFLAGLDRLIEITTMQGVESAFRVHKLAGKPAIAYDDTITIGTPDSVPNSQQLINLPESLRELARFPIKKGTLYHTGERETKGGFRFAKDYDEFDAPNYVLLDIHSHPDECVMPSEEDLTFLNNERRFYLPGSQIQDEDVSRFKERFGFIPSRIMAIIGVSNLSPEEKEGDNYLVSLVRERLPSPIDFNKEHLGNLVFETSTKMRRLSNGRSINEVGLYDVALGIYTPKEKQIEFVGGEQALKGFGTEVHS